MAKIQLLSWNYAPTNRPKESNADEDNVPVNDGFMAIEDCGPDGLPFN